MNAIAVIVKCAHGVPAGQPCRPCVVTRADKLAESDPGLRHMLREVRGSKYQAIDFWGSSRAPSTSELLAEVERIEKGGA